MVPGGTYQSCKRQYWQIDDLSGKVGEDIPMVEKEGTAQRQYTESGQEALMKRKHVNGKRDRWHRGRKGRVPEMHERD